MVSEHINYAGIIVGDRRTKSEGCYSRLERWRGTPATAVVARR